jgi:hypothetical protein
MRTRADRNFQPPTQRGESFKGVRDRAWGLGVEEEG